MEVPFENGQVFRGPWTDDDSIPDDVMAYRRVDAQGVEWTDGVAHRVRSYAFQPHRRSLSISVTLADRAIELDMDPVEVALPGVLAADFGLCRFQVNDARGLGFWIRRFPKTEDPAHAMMFVQNAESGEVPHKNGCKKLGKALAGVAVIEIPPAPPLPPIERS